MICDEIRCTQNSCFTYKIIVLNIDHTYRPLEVLFMWGFPVKVSLIINGTMAARMNAVRRVFMRDVKVWTFLLYIFISIPTISYTASYAFGKYTEMHEWNGFSIRFTLRVGEFKGFLERHSKCLDHTLPRNWRIFYALTITFLIVQIKY